jgi:hypothetical protein
MTDNPEVSHLGEKGAMRRSAEDTSGFGWLFVEQGKGIDRDSVGF